MQYREPRKAQVGNQFLEESGSRHWPEHRWVRVNGDLWVDMSFDEAVLRATAGEYLGLTYF